VTVARKIVEVCDVLRHMSHRQSSRQEVLLHCCTKYYFAAIFNCLEAFTLVGDLAINVLSSLHVIISWPEEDVRYFLTSLRYLSMIFR
jgi:hypothetical protein